MLPQKPEAVFDVLGEFQRRFEAIRFDGRRAMAVAENGGVAGAGAGVEAGVRIGYAAGGGGFEAFPLAVGDRAGLDFVEASMLDPGFVPLLEKDVVAQRLFERGGFDVDPDGLIRVALPARAQLQALRVAAGVPFPARRYAEFNLQAAVAVKACLIGSPCRGGCDHGECHEQEPALVVLHGSFPVRGKQGEK